MDYIAKAKRVLSLEISELQRLHDHLDDSFVRAVDILKESVEQQGKIVIAGVGKSGNIAGKIAATFNSTGAPSVVLNCQDALHGDLGLVDRGDVAVAVSYSGGTRELLNIVPHLKRRAASLIAITGRRESQLARLADCILNIEVKREACPLNLAPTSSTTNTLAMGDALAMVLLEARGFQKEHFAELHPGGALGHILLTKAKDIMRTGGELVTTRRESVVRDVLREMTEARTGAAIVVDEGHKLVGIFTQGDFTRAFHTDENIANREIGDFMTADPVSAQSEQLVGEVLKLLESHRIDDLVVLDDESKPVGMIDTQDLTRVRIF
ncbi:MAG: KpsF/GutQ family sugar-phosphate isomerase [Verrucomicrobiales bacterium]|nr:KpsF/GutQ family sugar-phosphate isomerase [Verrucomicrobiales bacterium]